MTDDPGFGLMIEDCEQEPVGLFRAIALNLRHKHTTLDVHLRQPDAERGFHALVIGSLYMMTIYDLRKAYLEMPDPESITNQTLLDEVSQEEGVLREHREMAGKLLDVTIRSITVERLLDCAHRHQRDIWGREITAALGTPTAQRRGYATGYAYIRRNGHRVLALARRTVRLEPARQEHASLVFRWLSDPANPHIEPNHAPWTLVCEAVFASALNQRPPDDVAFLIVRQSDNEPIGLVTSYRTNVAHRVTHSGMVMAPPFRSGPYAALGFALFLEYLGNQRKMRKVYMETYTGNRASLEPLLGIGEVEAVLKDHIWYGGRTWDQYVLAIHAEPALKALVEGDSALAGPAEASRNAEGARI